MSRKEKEIIHKSIDREMNKEETRIFKKKILTDSRQKQEYRELKRVVDTTKLVKKVKPSGSFAKKIVKELRIEKKK